MTPLVMDRRTGKALTGEAAIAHQISIILSTRIGSIVCQRDFGSELPDLVGQPMNPGNLQRLLGATALALLRWMPGLKILRLAIVRGDQPGAWTVEITRQSLGLLSVPLAF